jgi:uncharacterized protein involved in type VI secretion and phage assembly
MPVIINEIEVEVEPPRLESTPPSQAYNPESLLAAADDYRNAAPLPAAPHYGVYPAVVRDIADPLQQGRVEVALPWALDTDGEPYHAWARLATLAAGNGRGSWFIPEVDDEVLVTFESGDPSKPYVIGSLWNGRDAPPTSMDAAGQNGVKMLRTRSGLQVSLDDTSGSERLELSTPGGQKLLLADSSNSIEITTGDSKVTIKAGQIEIETSGKLVVDANTVELNTSMLTVNAALAKFSGVVQADTLIANSVVSASYTPGAGNIW